MFVSHAIARTHVHAQTARPLAESHSTNERLVTMNTKGRGRPDRDVKAIMIVWLTDPVKEDRICSVWFNWATCGSSIFRNHYKIHCETLYDVARRFGNLQKPELLHFEQHHNNSHDLHKMKVKHETVTGKCRAYFGNRKQWDWLVLVI